MRITVIVLIGLLGFLQYKLWFAPSNLRDVASLRQQVEDQTLANKRLRSRNKSLAAEVENLKTQTAAVQERARNDLGMIKRNEHYYQFVKKNQS